MTIAEIPASPVTLPAFMQPENAENVNRLAEEAEKRNVVMPAFMADDWDDEVEDIHPELLSVEGAAPLLYRGESHYIAGTGGSGKSWTVQHTIAEIVKSDPTAVVVFVDYESSRKSLRERLLALVSRRSRLGGLPTGASRTASSRARPRGGHG